MKKPVIIILIIAIVIGVGLYFGFRELDAIRHKGKVQIAGVWVDEENVNRVKAGFDEGNAYYAEARGDSYCADCGKYIEGRVR